LFWVLAVVVVMLTVFSFDGNGGYTTITTAQAEKLIVRQEGRQGPLDSCCSSVCSGSS
jgi:hypothetical protein